MTDKEKISKHFYTYNQIGDTPRFCSSYLTPDQFRVLMVYMNSNATLLQLKRYSGPGTLPHHIIKFMIVNGFDAIFSCKMLSNVVQTHNLLQILSVYFEVDTHIYVETITLWLYCVGDI